MGLKFKCAFVWLLLAVTISFLQTPAFKCWMDRGNSVIQAECRNNGLIGNKCHIVCSALNTNCYLYHASKDLVRVVVVEAESGEVVIKHKHIPVLTEEYTQSLLPLDGERPEVFLNLVNSMVRFELNGEDSDDALSLLWPWQNSSAIISEQNGPLLKQIVRLAHNDEYKLMQLHGHLQLFPRVLGTCGDIYVVEHVTVMLDRPLLDVLPAFTDTCHVVHSARRILLYLIHLSSVLPLHLCDLQWGHFGAAADGRVRFVDLDAAFTQDKLAATQRMTACSTDAECDFFDCRGACDTTLGHCRPTVSDNISNLCRQLVWPRAPLLGAGRRLGLLAAVLAEREARLLESCARSRTAQHAQQVADMLRQLEQRLCS